jgi:hypothetical protein
VNDAPIARQKLRRPGVRTPRSEQGESLDPVVAITHQKLWAPFCAAPGKDLSLQPTKQMYPKLVESVNPPISPVI